MGALTFYFDRCFGKRFPETLKWARPPFGVEYHHNKTNKFKQDADDDEWLAIVGSKGWVVFSHDRKFHEESAALDAIQQHKIGCFYLWGAQAETWEKLRCFVRSHAQITNLAEQSERPFIYEVSKSCRIQRIKVPS